MDLPNFVVGCILILGLGMNVKAQITYDITGSERVTEGVGTLEITVTRTCTTACPTKQIYHVIDDGSSNKGTANPVDDFLDVNEFLTFAQGDTFKTFEVTIIDDDEPEDPCEEDFFLLITTISTDDGQAVPTDQNDAKTRFVITDNDIDLVDLSSFALSVTGGNSIAETDSEQTVTLTVTRTCTGTCPCTGDTVQLETRGVTATTADDYGSLVNVVVTFTGTETTKTVDLVIKGDDIPEEDETFDIAIAQLNGVDVEDANDEEQEITIVDDDVSCTIVDSSYSEREGSDVTITVRRNGAFSLTKTCVIRSKDDSAEAPDDYLSVVETVTFDPKGDPTDVSSQEETFTIDIINDNEKEVSEILNICLTEVDGVSVPAGDIVNVEVEILDDDALIEFEKVEYRLLEGALCCESADCLCDNSGKKGVCITLTRDGYLERVAKVELTTDVTIGDGDPAEATDYEELNGFEVEFQSGDNSKHVCLEISDDKFYEQNELFRVVITDPANQEDIIGDVDKSVAQVTITNNDADICIDTERTYKVSEGEGEVTVYFKREGYLGREAFIEFNITDGSAADNEYEPTDGYQVKFSVGESEAAVVIKIDETDDLCEIGDEKFTVTIPDAENQDEDIGSTIGGPTDSVGDCVNVDVTITEDDAKISIKDFDIGYTVVENADVIIKFEREGYYDRTQTFFVETLDKTDDSSYQATSGSNCDNRDENCDFDRLTSSTRVTFNSGQSETFIKIPINDDIFKESNEKFGVQIKQDENAKECIDPDKDETFVTIEDNDAVIWLKDYRWDLIEEYKQYEHKGAVTLVLGREGGFSRAQSAFVRTTEIDELVGQATIGQDFVDRTGVRVRFGVGSAEAKINITLVNDEFVEPDETFLVTIYNENEYIDEERNNAVITIHDDDAKCTIQAPDPSQVSEADNSPVCFTIWRNGYTGRAGSCNVKTLLTDSDVKALNLVNNGEATATSGGDLFDVSETVTFGVGVESDNTQFCPTVRQDDGCEISENVYAIIDNPPGNFDKYTQAAYFTILDDEPEGFRFLPPFTWEVNEGTGFILIQVYRCGDISKEGSCSLRFEDASAGSSGRKRRQDFETPLPEDLILVFPPGVFVAVANVSIVNDNLVEGLEGFNVYIQGITGDTIAGSIAGKVNIIDDDSLYSLELPFYTISESGGNLMVKIIRNSNYLGTSGSVDVSTSALIDAIGGDVSLGTVGLDFELLTNQTVTFGSTQENQYVVIPIANDAISEFSETFRVYLSNPDGGINSEFESATVTILDDDAVYYQFEEDEYHIIENGGIVTVHLERFGSVAEVGSVRIEFRSASDQGLDKAEPTNDFVATDAWVYFPVGDHTAETTFRVINDNTREEKESFGMFLTETGRVGEYLYSPKDDATVYITDDDDYPLVTYSMRATGLTVDESENTVELYVERASSSSYLPPGNAYIVIEERANSAKKNQDFAIGDLVARFGEDQSEAKVIISIIDSPEIEPTEIFTAVLETVEGGNAVIDFPSRTDITILDHSVVFSFIGNAYSVSESQRSVVIRIQRSGSTENSASVGLVSVSGSATDTKDYETINTRVTFDRIETIEEFAVLVNIDEEIERPEAFTLRLRDPSNGAVIGAEDLVTITILDSTYRPPTQPPEDRSVCYTFGESTYEIDEDDGKVYFTITRSGPGVDEAGRIRFYTNSGSALPGQDYISKESVIFFDPSHTSKTTYVDILDFDGKEDQEFFTVHLTDPEGADAKLCDISVGTVNIKDVEVIDGLSTAIIIAIAVAGIVLLLLFLAFCICICFRSPPRERENVIVMSPPKLPPPPPPVEPIIIEHEPEPKPEPEEVIRIIRRVPVPVLVGSSRNTYGPGPEADFFGPDRRYAEPTVLLPPPYLHPSIQKSYRY